MWQLFIRGRCGTAMAFICALSATAAADVIYVDDNATPGGDGASWKSAFNDLQLALAIAQEGDEIRVAQGIYKPAPPIPAGGSRDATFQLVNATTLRGGYAGIGADDPDANDPAKYETILSGDLNNDDGPNWDNIGENCYNVITANGVDASTSLHGLIIQSGNANLYAGSPWNDRRMFGGGVCGMDEAAITIAHCTFRANQSHYGSGGAIRIHQLFASQCLFTRNRNAGAVDGAGGAVYIFGGRIEDSTFFANSTNNSGGAILSGSVATRIVIKRTRFEGNGAVEAGGALVGGRFDVINSDFVSNGAVHGGGACQVNNSVFVNCRFIRNASGCMTPAGFGSAIGSYANTHAYNCLFTGNKGSHGAFMVRDQQTTTPHSIVNCTFIGNETLGTNCGVSAIHPNAGTIILNTVAWENHYPNYPSSNPTQQSQISAVPGMVLRNSVIQGWDGTLGGVNNHGNDPRFIDADGPDDIYGTEDDNPRLRANSPLIDRGDTSALPPDTFDLDGDGDTTEPLPVDLDWLPRVVGASVDVGAFEFQGTPCLPDIDGSGTVNVADLFTIITAWGACTPAQPCNADLNLNGHVDVGDLLQIIMNWGPCG